VIARPTEIKRLATLVRRNPVTAILGARQVGKTTLALQFAETADTPFHRFDLENPTDLARLADPMIGLGGLHGLVILDEVQRRPDLFPVLRVLADRPAAPARFLLLGSASPDLVQRSSESLAGRIAYHELRGFGLDEVGVDQAERLWLRGGFPRAFLAESDAASAEWRRDFVRTFLERDLAQLGVRVPAETLRRFWTMVAHYHGQVWSGAELARSFGVSDTTVRRYLDVLTAALVLRQLSPWHENLGKRQVKAPKVFVSDTGLLHSLLGIETTFDLGGHPKVGASWEGFAATQVIRQIGARPDECYFWATHGGAELDLLVVRGQRRYGFEFKYTAAPSVTKSMHSARQDLHLDRLDVVHAGEAVFPMREGIRAVALRSLQDALEPL
jgi:hypothetical protein